MAVYLDELVLLNFVLDYLLLLASGRVAGEVLRRGRIALGAALGALYAGASVLPRGVFLRSPPCKLAAAVGMVLLAYGACRRLLRVGLIFLCVSAALGGGVLALELLGGRGLVLRNGILSSALDLKVILLSAAVCYLVVTLVFARAGRHSAVDRELRPAVLRLGDRSVALTALVDTGNTLTDPATGRTVMVAEGAKLAALFPEGEAPEPGDLSDPANALLRFSGRNWQGRARLVPYRAVGVDCGLLLALRMDRVLVGGEDYGGILVALSPNAVSDGGGYSALIGA